MFWDWCCYDFAMLNACKYSSSAMISDLNPLCFHEHKCVLDPILQVVCTYYVLRSAYPKVTIIEIVSGDDWYISVVSTFPNAFPLVLDSNLHDLNETNPYWRYFQQNYHGVVFGSEIDVVMTLLCLMLVTRARVPWFQIWTHYVFMNISVFWILSCKLYAPWCLVGSWAPPPMGLGSTIFYLFQNNSPKSFSNSENFYFCTKTTPW